MGIGKAGELACIVQSHRDPEQTRRLIAALDPFPVFLHVDRNTDESVYQQIIRDLDDRVRVLPRYRASWGSWGIVAAELTGMQQALQHTDAGHIAVISGSDYPLITTDQLSKLLIEHEDRSLVDADPLPRQYWRGGGYWRFRYRFWAVRRQIVMLPIPRRPPPGVVLAGGARMKVLSRRHVIAILAALAARSDLERFFRRVWLPDESLIPALLMSPEITGIQPDEYVRTQLWFEDWGELPSKSPRWLTPEYLPAIKQALALDTVGPVFCRKIDTKLSGELTELIDAQLRVG